MKAKAVRLHGAGDLRLDEFELPEITDDEISGKIYIRNKPSFLAYARDTLWVGTYAGKKGKLPVLPGEKREENGFSERLHLCAVL